MDEAAEAAAQAVADVMSREGREADLVREMHRQAFEVFWSHGDLAAARDGNAAALATYGSDTPGTFVRADLLQERAAIEIAYGHPAEALAAVAQAEAIADRLGLPRASMMRGNLALRRGRALLATGDATDARALFEEQAKYWRAGESGLAGLRVELEVNLIDALLALGDVVEARRIAEEAEAEFARESGRPYMLETDALLQHAIGRVFMAEQSWPDALSYLERSTELFAAVHVSHSPERAEAEARRAICLARLGRRDEALAALVLARTAEAKHGSLGERWRKPLREAEALAQASRVVPARPTRP